MAIRHEQRRANETVVALLEPPVLARRLGCLIGAVARISALTQHASDVSRCANLDVDLLFEWLITFAVHLNDVASRIEAPAPFCKGDRTSVDRNRGLCVGRGHDDGSRRFRERQRDRYLDVAPGNPKTPRQGGETGGFSRHSMLSNVQDDGLTQVFGSNATAVDRDFGIRWHDRKVD